MHLERQTFIIYDPTNETYASSIIVRLLHYMILCINSAAIPKYFAKADCIYQLVFKIVYIDKKEFYFEIDLSLLKINNN